MSEGIEGKVVLIIGGAGGIGAETARTLASKGALLAVADISATKANELVDGIRRERGTAMGYQLDVTRKNEVKSVIDSVVRDFGKLDVLINSAGIMFIRPMSDINTTEWELTIDLNVKGTLWGIAAALPVFLKQGSGHIVNLGSVHGLKVFSPGGTVHSGSKFAIRAISEGLRTEMAGQGIRVTMVTPGAVDSGIQNKTTGSDRARILEIYKNAIPPNAVARAIAFAIEQPAAVDVNEIVVRPAAQMI
jgi:NADP-dependent 3-hydroxy acid dehydrogenase YdfG